MTKDPPGWSTQRKAGPVWALDLGSALGAWESLSSS